MNAKELKKGEIIIYQAKDGPKLDVRLEEETLWLTLNQIASLFDVQKAAISKHIKNIFNSKELDESSTVSKMETVQMEGNRKIKRTLNYFNLDMIISIGYRVNSKRATQFRIWATKTLKEHLVKGYTINEKRLLQIKSKLNDLQEAISFLREKYSQELLSGQEQEILDLLANYSRTLSLLEQYDKETLSLIKQTKCKFVLKYQDAINVIKEIKKELVKKKRQAISLDKKLMKGLKAFLEISIKPLTAKNYILL